MPHFRWRSRRVARSWAHRDGCARVGGTLDTHGWSLLVMGGLIREPTPVPVDGILQKAFPGAGSLVADLTAAPDGYARPRAVPGTRDQARESRVASLPLPVAHRQPQRVGLTDSATPARKQTDRDWRARSDTGSTEARQPRVPSVWS